MQARSTSVLQEHSHEAADLQGLLDLLEKGDVEGARAWVGELRIRWPDSEQVQHYARVLAPPVAKVASGGKVRSFELERRWLSSHAREYPGCWLAVLGDRLVAAEPALDDVLRQLRATSGTEDAVLFFQPHE